MGQYWKLLNIDGRAHTGHLGKLRECISSFPMALNKMLQSQEVSLRSEPDPAVLREILNAVGISDETAIGGDESTPVFDGLSTEMVDAVIDHLEQNVLDMICFGLCSRRLWNITRPRLEARLNPASSRWAGHRIICIGDYAGRLPEGMLAEGELEALAASDGDGDGDGEDNLYYIGYAWEEVQNLTPRSLARPLAQRGLALKGRDGLLWAHLQEPWAAPSATPLVLRDLTSREYVRETALQAWKERKEEALYGVRGVTLGHVCGFRICWSSDMDVTMKSCPRLHRGVWAGHRFDIVAEAEWVPEEGSGGGDKAWRDVSEEALAEAGKIWAAGY